MSATVPAGPQNARASSWVFSGSTSLMVLYICIPGNTPDGPISSVVSLGKIKSEHPVKSRMPQIVIVHITILMPLLSSSPRRIQVTMSMGVQNVIGSQQTRQGTLHIGVLKHAPDLRNPRQNIISGIAFCRKNRLDLIANTGVKRRWIIRLHSQTSIDDKPLHFFVAQQPN